jgi:hypothetical protein
MPTIKAIFQGKDGSLGYRSNHIYELRVSKGSNGAIFIHRKNDKHDDGGCFYDSEKMFLRNWATSRKVLIEKAGNPTI